MDSFQEGQLGVMIELTELSETKKGTPENQQALERLTEVLQDILKIEEGQVLFNICNSIVTLANSGFKTSFNGFFEEKIVSIHDLALLRIALKELIEKVPEEKRGKVKMAISRVQPWTVSLFMAARLGGKFFYWDSKDSKVRKYKYFQGIPEEMWPKKDDQDEKRPFDFRINAKNAKHIYGALLSLSLDSDPTTKERSYRRRGEAKFFLDHLPQGLFKKVKEENS